jgi:hypothetical protein
VICTYHPVNCCSDFEIWELMMDSSSDEEKRSAHKFDVDTSWKVGI